MTTGAVPMTASAVYPVPADVAADPPVVPSSKSFLNVVIAAALRYA